MRRTPLALVLGFILFAASAAVAQIPHDYEHDDEYDHPHRPRVPSGVFMGGTFDYARPQGEFRRNVEQGFGGAVHMLWQPAARGVLGLRLDAGFLTYGHERMRVPLSSTIGGRILVDVNTSNNIAFVGVGPQIGLPEGRLRPYLGGFVGWTYLFTESTLEGRDDELEFARTTNYDDATFTYGGRGGLYVPIRGGPAPISVDVGATYQNGGEAAYLREGDIRDHPDGSISFTPSVSDTDLVRFHLGVTVGIPREVRRR